MPKKYRRKVFHIYVSTGQFYKNKKNCPVEVDKSFCPIGRKIHEGSGFDVFHYHNYQLYWFCNYYNIKSNEKWCFVVKQFSDLKYAYSMQAVEFIVEEIKKDPDNILNNIRKSLKKIS